MEILVGDKGCEASQIITTIQKSAVPNEVLRKLARIAMELKVDSELTDEMGKRMMLDKSKWEVLQAYIENWRGRQLEDRDARLIIFIEILEEMDLNSAGKALRKAYGIEDKSSSIGSCAAAAASAANEEGEMNQSDIDKQIDHLDNILPDLIGMTDLTPILLAIFIREKILSQADVRKMNAIQFRDERTTHFFGIIRDRLKGDNPNAYDIVTNAFEKERQTGVSEALKRWKE